VLVADGVGVLRGDTGGVCVGTAVVGSACVGLLSAVGVGAPMVGSACVGSLGTVGVGGATGWDLRGVGEEEDAAPTGTRVGVAGKTIPGRVDVTAVPDTPPLTVLNGARCTSTRGVARKVVGAGLKVAAAWPGLTSA
jgi:hypothetical protein